ncbi:hypothetical protein BGZ94_009008, partial [Podila epigama]
MAPTRTAGQIDTLYRIPMTTDGPWFFVPVLIGTPPQAFDVMLDTGSSLSWIQTEACYATPTLCNVSPKFHTSNSSSIKYQPEMISVKYTEGIITTQLASDVLILGSSTAAPINNGTIVLPHTDSIDTQAHHQADSDSHQKESSPEQPDQHQIQQLPPTWPSAVFKGVRTFGLTNDVSGDQFLLTKETHVTGFLGASRGRFETDSDYSTH